MGRNYTDYQGYKRDGLRHTHSDLISRQIAYNQIYLPNKHEYSLPFSKYIVHHKDENKLNNHASNLQIITQEIHQQIHGISKSLHGEQYTVIKKSRLNAKQQFYLKWGFPLIILVVGIFFGKTSDDNTIQKAIFGIGIVVISGIWVFLSIFFSRKS